MSIDLRLHIARILCLLMAVYLLNFSIDTRTGKNNSTGIGDVAAIKGTVEVENLLCLVLDLNMEVEIDTDLPEKAENESETESVDVLDFFHGVSSFSLYAAHSFLQEQLLHLPNPDLRTLNPEVICLPPKELFPSAVA